MSSHASRSVRLLASLVLALGVAACAPGGAGPADGTAITMWHSLTGARERALLDFVDTWNAGNRRGITVVAERRSLAALRVGVTDGVARGALPGLMLIPTPLAANYQRKDLLAPLDAYIGSADPAIGLSADDRADLLPFVLGAASTPDGRRWGMAFGGSVRLMLYNRDWLSSLNFDAPPADWDTFEVSCARAADSRRGTACFPIFASAAGFADWVLSHGGRLTSPDAGRVTLNTAQARDAMGRIVSLQRANYFLRVSQDSQVHAEFGSGRSLFAFEWSDHLPDIQVAIRQGADFEWGIASPPRTAQTAASLYRGGLWVIPRTRADQQDAAWQFLRWLFSPENARRWADATGDLAARASAYPADGNRLASVRAVAQRAVAEPFVPGWDCAQASMGSAVQQVMDGFPIEDTLVAAEAEAQATLASYCGP